MLSILDLSLSRHNGVNRESATNSSPRSRRMNLWRRPAWSACLWRAVRPGARGHLGAARSEQPACDSRLRLRPGI
jgi:hypothetical protein